MNNLFSSSWKRAGDDLESGGGGGVEMSAPPGAAAGASLDRFFEDVESIKDELRDLERIQRALHDGNEGGKSLHDAAAVRALRSRMDADVSAAIKKAKVVKLRLESLDRANAANRSLPGCGPGSSTDRTRTSVVAGLRKKLRDSMETFSSLRGRITSEYRDTVARRYFTVTGAQPDEKTLDNLAETGEGERFLQRAIAEQQGRGEVQGVVAEIQERHGAVAQLERSLLELQQVFNDMAVQCWWRRRGSSSTTSRATWGGRGRSSTGAGSSCRWRASTRRAPGSGCASASGSFSSSSSSSSSPSYSRAPRTTTAALSRLWGICDR